MQKLDSKINFFEIKISLNSSFSEIKNTLMLDSSGNSISAINFIVCKNFNILVHHHRWHLQLIKDSNIDYDDIYFEGKVHIYKKRVVVIFKGTRPISLENTANADKFKSTEDTPDDYMKNYREAERRNLLLIKMIENKLSIFLSPILNSSILRK